LDNHLLMTTQTPETDIKEIKHILEHGDTNQPILTIARQVYSLILFTRKLERERDEANQQVLDINRHYQDLLVCMVDKGIAEEKPINVSKARSLYMQIEMAQSTYPRECHNIGVDLINKALLDAFKAGERFAAELVDNKTWGDAKDELTNIILTDANNRTKLP
jgi:hypothetical protein